ncbi:hypothetical protein NQ317_006276 [Molorchus minor]|uniref:Uncharacterized protein n=1 Tax=Molorchus minor TaxID=1323400 RepID=A0ABQ9J3U3_9CUCU|nr:hypothetical protein NQ317_006276 [Molorchus minor]
MPNLQALGITGQGQQGSNQQNCNPLGLGLNLGALPMNPALVAAALNQAGWGLIGNLQNQPEPNFNQGGFNSGPNNSNAIKMEVGRVATIQVFKLDVSGEEARATKMEASGQGHHHNSLKTKDF